jgi:hypothetical protein
MAARELPTVLIPNTHNGILDYLAQRTADTIGEKLDGSDLIVVSKVLQTEARNVPVRPEDAALLQRWLSGEAGRVNEITIFVILVEVEEVLVGNISAKQIEIAYPGTRGSGGEFFPNFNVNDRGLLFLRNISPDAPYAFYIQQPAYQLSEHERGMRSFLVTDYDDQGQPFTRDETAKVQETIEAVRWYTTLPQEKDPLHQYLLTALDHTNSQVVHHAIRALANQGDATVAAIFKQRLQGSTEELRVRLMLGLWILGDKESARNILDEFFQTHGKYQWLRHFGIEPTVVDAGQEPDTLLGPDPSEIKGD